MSHQTRRILADHEDRLRNVEKDCEAHGQALDAMQDIASLNETLTKVWRFIKWGGPLVITAAVTSGIVSGRWGAFLNALFSG